MNKRPNCIKMTQNHYNEDLGRGLIIGQSVYKKDTGGNYEKYS